MQKTRIFTLTIMVALLVCSAFSVAAAEETATASAIAPPDEIKPTKPTVNPDETIPPDGSRSLDEPVGYGDDILYTIQDDNIDKSVNGTDGEEPQLYGDEIYATGASDTNGVQGNTAFIVAATGVVVAIAVGGALGFVYYHKTRA